MSETRGNAETIFAVDGYPRICQSLAPSRLLKYLCNPAPEWLINRSSDYEYLCDLDASAWNCVSHAEAVVLAGLVVESIRQQVEDIVSDIGNQALFDAVPSCLDEPLRVSAETAETLSQLRLGPFRLDRVRVCDVLRNGGDGVFALVDLFVSLEYWGFGRDQRWKQQVELSRTARKAELLLSGADVGSTDPRLGAAIGSVRATLPYHVRNLTVTEMCMWLADHAHAVDDVLDAAGNLHDLVTLIEAIESESLPEQVTQVVSATAKLERDARILLRRYGLDGNPPATLQEVADEENLTRERIRQICVRTEGQLAKLIGSPYAPALDRALALLDQAAPLTTEAAARMLRGQVSTSECITVEAILEAARLLHRSASIELRDSGPVHWVCHPGDEVTGARDVSTIRTRAGRLCDSSGATTLDSLREALSKRDHLDISIENLVALLPHLPGFEWLDEDLGWFWVVGRNVRRNRFFNLLTKVLSVAGQLSLDEVRHALRRSRRLIGPFPPASVLREMCERQPGIHLQGQVVRPDAPLDHRQVLQGTELYVVELLMQLGNVARVEDMWQIAGSEGVGRVSFWVTLQNSPAIVKYARSTYGLRGMPVPATEIWEVANKRVKRANSVLRDWGSYSDSAYWMLFKLSSRAVQSGQVSIPADFNGQIDGEYSLCFQGRQIPGVVTVREAHMWGLRRLFRSAEVELGDWALIVLSLSTGTVHAQVGDEELSLSDETDIAELLEAGCVIEPTEEAVSALPEQSSLLDAPGAGSESEELDELLDSDVVLVREVLSHAYRPLKAREIASAIGLMYGEALSRSDVNRILYGVLKHEVKGEDGNWMLVGGKIDSGRSDPI